MNSTTKDPRPLSPFLLYRWQYTMALSFLHRVTGCALTIGALLFVYWLSAAAGGDATYARALDFFGHPLIRAVLVLFSFAFFYHLLNGVRHLVWDVGKGFERGTARKSGWAAFLAAVALTGLFWVVLASRVGGGAA